MSTACVPHQVALTDRWRHLHLLDALLLFLQLLPEPRWQVVSDLRVKELDRLADVTLPVVLRQRQHLVPVHLVLDSGQVDRPCSQETPHIENSNLKNHSFAVIVIKIIKWLHL